MTTLNGLLWLAWQWRWLLLAVISVWLLIVAVGRYSRAAQSDTLLKKKLEEIERQNRELSDKFTALIKTDIFGGKKGP